MSSEPAAAKAVRLLASGRVRIVAADGCRARAVVAGDTGEHVVEVDSTGSACDCGGSRGRRPCSHRLAVELVVAPELLEPDV